MPTYRRAYVRGGIYFFTVTLLERRQRLLVDHIDDLRAAFRAVRAERPFTIDAVVVLPDHLHCVWTLPPEDADFSTRWRLIKTRFARAIPNGERLTTRRARAGERGIWQRRFWEHCIRDEHDYAAHVDYIHFNPVKHGHVVIAADWPYSSFRRFAAAGQYPEDWAAAPDVRELEHE
jgi:putative transposase